MKNSIKITLVSAFPPGRQSLNEYGLHLAIALAEMPQVAEVIVLADLLDGPVEELDLGPKVRVERVWRFNSLKAAPSILRSLRSHAPDGAVWNVQTATFGDREIPAALGLMAPAIARYIGLPSGIIAHNLIAGINLENTVLRGNRLRQMIVSAGGKFVTRAMMAANYCTVTLRSYSEMLKQSYPNANVHLVPHGTFDTKERTLTNSANRPMRIVTMGKFGTYKKLETLLRAFDIIRCDQELTDLELVIGGSDHPNTPGYLETIANARSTDSAVNFRGYIAEEDIPEFFGNARLSVFDYFATTGSSGVLHQTASYGAVPVFPKIGDFVDLCDDEGLTGVNYQPLDALSMANAMRRVLHDPNLADELSAKNAISARSMPISQVAAFHVKMISAATYTSQPSFAFPFGSN